MDPSGVHFFISSLRLAYSSRASDLKEETLQMSVWRATYPSFIPQVP